jgi:hypothetical protein
MSILEALQQQKRSLAEQGADHSGLASVQRAIDLVAESGDMKELQLRLEKNQGASSLPAGFRTE